MKLKAHMKQHMLSHCIERVCLCPFTFSHLLLDHLTHHSSTHGGLFTCPGSNCNCKFGIKAHMKRHMREIHEDDSSREGQKQYVCHEPGCGKTFKYPSKLKKHEDTHGKSLCFRLFFSSLPFLSYKDIIWLFENIHKCRMP
ncbi:unnamed protein product [Musa acuminata subsp. burmannicoides]